MILFLILLCFSVTRTFALDLVEINSTLGDAFESFIDPNEGQTSFRSMNIPMGGRVESMGTAFTGLCDDISFFDYNPAASSVLEQSEVAVFHNAWIADSAMECLTATRRNGNFGYGGQIKCFYVPFTEYNLFGEKLTGSYYSETSAAFNLSYNFLSGYSFKGIALGLNTKIAWRSIPDYTDNKTDEIISGSGLEQSALAFMADAGMIMSFNLLKHFVDRNPNFRIGLAFNNLGAAITGFGNQIKLDDPLSTRASLGISYRPFSRFLLSLEFRQPLNLQDFASSGKFSAGSGFEIKITDGFAFEMGFLLQGANPRFSMGSEFDVMGLKMDVCYTFDLTSSSNPVNHISLSAKMKFGDRGRKAALQVVDEIYIEGLRLYANGEYTEAILKWNDAIKAAKEYPLNIKYEPAIIARNQAITFNRNMQALQNVQNLIEE
ncbi:MAG: UPF0164 family protein [Treponema sp.]|nr:UPF0164 family protein [Candidatus Treponema equifaecale]